jgi:hypothetical protein
VERPLASTKEPVQRNYMMSKLVEIVTDLNNLKKTMASTVNKIRLVIKGLFGQALKRQKVLNEIVSEVMLISLELSK